MIVHACVYNVCKVEMLSYMITDQSAAAVDLEVCDDFLWRRRETPDQCDTAVSRSNSTKILGNRKS